MCGEFGRPSKRQCLIERWDSHLGQKSVLFPDLWLGSPLHCNCGEGSERRESTLWCRNRKMEDTVAMEVSRLVEYRRN